MMASQISEGKSVMLQRSAVYVGFEEGAGIGANSVDVTL